ncbi:MAG: elongation factor Ts [bacterium]
MVKISMDVIKQLREKSGVGFADCKVALEEANGDLEKAYEILRKKGMAKLAKRSDKETNAGYVGTYVHHNGQLVGIAVVTTETDFVSRDESFQTFAKEMAMQVASQNPEYINIEDVPAERVAKEKEIYMAEVEKTGKPKAIAEKIASGKLSKFYEEVVLMEQPWVKDPSKKIKDVYNEILAKLGEKILVRNIYRITISG